MNDLGPGLGQSWRRVRRRPGVAVVVVLTLALGIGANAVGHVLRDTVVLAALGGTLGLALASIGVSALRQLSPEGFPRLEELRLDGRVVAWSVLLSVVTGIAAGLIPALRGSCIDLVTALKPGDRATRGDGPHRLHDLLVVGEFALAMVLLVGAGLLTKSFLRLLDPRPGFRPDGLLTLTLSFSASPLGEPEKQGPFFDELLKRVRPLPGVFGDARQSSLTEPIGPEIVFPYASNPTPWYRASTLLVRTRVEPLTLVETVKARSSTSTPACRSPTRGP